MKPIVRRALDLLLTVLIAYTIVLLIVRSWGSHFIFFPNTPSRLDGDWHPHTLPVRDLQLTADDGTKLHAWWIPNNDARWTFLAFHGNAANIANRVPTYEFLRSLPANIFALEYRGYGHSEGSPSESGIYRDADAAYKYLVGDLAVHPKSIISFGQSLGTAVAADLASRREVGAVVLEAPFPSASVMARKFFWFLPGVDLLVRGQLNTVARLKQVTEPVLIVHCTQDPVIPFELGQTTFAAANQPKQFLAINGYCHEESSGVAPNQYRPALQQFLNTLPN
jgi:uncharacterized protein